MKEGRNLLNSEEKRRQLDYFVFSVLFSGFCVIDQIIGSMPGNIQFMAKNCTGIILGLVTIYYNGFRYIKKRVFAFWSITVFVGAFIISLWGYHNYVYRGQWITAVINVFIYSFIGIQEVYKKKCNNNIRKKISPYIIVWLVMMLMMVVSRNDNVWPLWFLIMFGSLYFLDMDLDKRLLLMESMCNGMILGCFLVQGAAFVFRPFGYPRYLGMYANCNMNALLYLVSFCALFGKAYFIKIRNPMKKYYIIFCVGAGILWDFTMLTCCKSALLSEMIVLCLAVALFDFTLADKIKRVKTFFTRIILFCVTSCFCFPLVFFSVRYFPAFFHHPIWFADEYYEGTIHSWDPINSEKYVDFDEWLKEFVGRFDFEETEKTANDIIDLLFPPVKTYAQGINTQDQPLFEGTDIGGSWQTRIFIYKAYIKNLNLFGHRQNEEGVWVTSDYFASHAHNLFLQMAYQFGIIPGLLFVAMVISEIFFSYRLIKRGNGKDALGYAGLLLVVGAVSFGMFEVMWRIGQCSFTILFMNFGLCLNEESDINRLRIDSKGIE